MSKLPKAVNMVLRLIGELYLREQEWDAANVSAALAALRQEHFARSLRWLRRLGIRWAVRPEYPGRLPYILLRLLRRESTEPTYA